jgi:hypothetical protein
MAEARVSKGRPTRGSHARLPHARLIAGSIPALGKWEQAATDLQDDPDVYDQVAAHENPPSPIDFADLVEKRQPVDPGLAGRDAEHGDEGQVEPAEAAWHELLEKCHPEDGVWARGREGMMKRAGGGALVARVGASACGWEHT